MMFIDTVLVPIITPIVTNRAASLQSSQSYLPGLNMSSDYWLFQVLHVLPVWVTFPFPSTFNSVNESVSMCVYDALLTVLLTLTRLEQKLKNERQTESLSFCKLAQIWMDEFSVLESFTAQSGARTLLFIYTAFHLLQTPKRTKNKLQTTNLAGLKNIYVY